MAPRPGLSRFWTAVAVLLTTLGIGFVWLIPRDVALPASEVSPFSLAPSIGFAAPSPGVFYRVRELEAGDEVAITRQDGSVATFRVDRVEDYPKDQFPTAAVYGDLHHAGLRLITCGRVFDEDTGDYEDDVVVFATLAPTAF